MSAIFGPSILRDFQQRHLSAALHQADFQSSIISAGAGPRSFVITLLVFSGLVFGAIVGAFMPWADKERIAPDPPLDDCSRFFPSPWSRSFSSAACFFASRRFRAEIVVVYLQGVVLFALYLILLVSVVSGANKLDRTWPSVFDPLGIVLAGQHHALLDRGRTQHPQLITGPACSSSTASSGSASAFWLWRSLGFSSRCPPKCWPRAHQPRARRRCEPEEDAEPTAARSASCCRRSPSTSTPRTTRLQLCVARRVCASRNISREIVFWAIALVMIVKLPSTAYFAGEHRGS